MSRKSDKLLSLLNKCPRSICRKGVVLNFIKVIQCKLWVHKRCKTHREVNREGRLCVWKMCRENRHQEHRGRVPQMLRRSLEGVDSFCPLKYQISSGGRCSESLVVKLRTGWSKVTSAGNCYGKNRENPC